MELDFVPQLSDNVAIERNDKIISISNAYGKYVFGEKESKIIQLMPQKLTISGICEITNHSKNEIEQFLILLNKLRVLRGNKTGWIKLTPHNCSRFFNEKGAYIFDEMWKVIVVMFFIAGIKQIKIITVYEIIQNDIFTESIWNIPIIWLFSMYIHELGHAFVASKKRCMVIGIFMQYRHPFCLRTVIKSDDIYRKNKFFIAFAGMRNNIFLIVFAVCLSIFYTQWSTFATRTVLLNVLIIILNIIPTGDSDGEKCLEEMRRWRNERYHKNGEC